MLCCGKSNQILTFVTVSKTTEGTCRITFSRIKFEKFLQLGGTAFKYFTQNDVVLKMIKFVQLFEVFKLHCLIEFFNCFVIFLSYYLFFQARVKLMGEKELVLLSKTSKESNLVTISQGFTTFPEDKYVKTRYIH